MIETRPDNLSTADVLERISTKAHAMLAEQSFPRTRLIGFLDSLCDSRKYPGMLSRLLVTLISTRFLSTRSSLRSQHQLAMLQQTSRRSRPTRFDLLFWIASSRYVDGWRAALHVLHPDTVVRWHRDGFRRYCAALTTEEKVRDREARIVISREHSHERQGGYDCVFGAVKLTTNHPLAP